MTARERLALILDRLPRMGQDGENQWRDGNGIRYSLLDHRDPDGKPGTNESSTSGRLAVGCYHGAVECQRLDGSRIATSNAVIIAPDGTVISAPSRWWELGVCETEDDL